MLDKKEKAVMLFLCEVCTSKRSYLISASTIAENLNKKFLMSVAEIDEIMMSLSKDNYIDVVMTGGRRGYFYCVMLKNKGLMFKKDLQKQKKEFALLLARTLCITVLSFVVGLLLRAIFN